jgi:hypothetical protein
MSDGGRERCAADLVTRIRREIPPLITGFSGLIQLLSLMEPRKMPDTTAMVFDKFSQNKRKLLDQVRNVIRLKRPSIGMKSPLD